MTHPQPDNLVGCDWSSIHGIHRFAHEAMATTFEIFIQHENARYARQAAAAAFMELDRLEGELSRFIDNSDVSRINNLNVNQSLRIGLAAFECLQLSAEIYNETNGAFDVTFGSKKFKIQNSKFKISAEGGGMPLIKMNEADFTVELLTSPVQIDLGGIGKGFALDRMADLLREWSIGTALLHGGYSTVLAIGAPADTTRLGARHGGACRSREGSPSRSWKGWPVTLSNPSDRRQILAYLYLTGRAVSSSGLQKGPHIIDPRTAHPVRGKLAAWACAADAATADALSTAFMVMTTNQIKQYCSHHPQVQAMVVQDEQGRHKRKEKILRFGRWKS
jgi:thiamine biosynthesis lipoprotein